MYVFIHRASLTLKPDEAVLVTMTLDDSAAITPDIGRPDSALFSLPSTAIRPAPLGGSTLAPGWREANAARVVSGEASRRIFDAFPEHAQRNAALELALGCDAKRKAEIARDWAFIVAIRKAAQAMLRNGLPADPSADGHWPKRG